MDSATLTVQALMEGNVLTTLRTPAISAVAADYLATPDASKLVVFGTGPQALSHIEAFSKIRSFTDVVVCGRTPKRSTPPSSTRVRWDSRPGPVTRPR